MDDKILALLGDRSAQERITERGELLPLFQAIADIERGIVYG